MSATRSEQGSTRRGIVTFCREIRFELSAALIGSVTLDRIGRMRILLLVSLFFAQSALAADHPGNVFLAGDDVRVTVPKTWAGWRAIDIDRKEVGHGAAGEGAAELGKLPIGYFEVREKDGPGMVTAAVLAKTTISDDTPIALDAASPGFIPTQSKFATRAKFASWPA